jgi:hypothetical protein
MSAQKKHMGLLCCLPTCNAVGLEASETKVEVDGPSAVYKRCDLRRYLRVCFSIKTKLGVSKIRRQSDNFRTRGQWQIVVQ